MGKKRAGDVGKNSLSGKTQSNQKVPYTVGEQQWDGLGRSPQCPRKVGILYVLFESKTLLFKSQYLT